MCELPDDIVREIASYDIDLRRILGKIGKISKEDIAQFERLLVHSRNHTSYGKIVTIVIIPYGKNKQYKLIYRKDEYPVIHLIKSKRLLGFYIKEYEDEPYVLYNFI